MMILKIEITDANFKRSLIRAIGANRNTDRGVKPVIDITGECLYNTNEEYK